MLTQNPTKSRLRIIEWRPLWPVTHVIGADPTKNELTAAVTYMANAKAVWLDELAVGFLPLGVNQDPTVLRDFLRVIILLMHQRRDAVVNVLHKIKKDTKYCADRGALYPEAVETVVKTPPGYCSTLKKHMPPRNMVPKIKQASLLVRKSNVTYDFLLSLYHTETFLGISACRLLPELHFKITPKLLIWAFAQLVVYTMCNNR